MLCYGLKGNVNLSLLPLHINIQVIVLFNDFDITHVISNVLLVGD
jgi:hypothetical protein